MKTLELNQMEEIEGGAAFWCKVSCTVGAMAIAASDGPSPLMDILAIAYQVSCLAACIEADN